MSWVKDKHAYNTIARHIEPVAKITTKSHWLWFALWLCPVILTLGLFAYFIPFENNFKKRATTIGPVQGYPDFLNRLDTGLLIHESRHSTQCVFFGWFVPVLGWATRSLRVWAGFPLFGLVYAIIPFPVLLCYGRYRLELDADKAHWEWMLANGATAEDVRRRAASFRESVAGSSYFFPWPAFLVRRGFNKTVERLIADYSVKAPS